MLCILRRNRRLIKNRVFRFGKHMLATCAFVVILINECRTRDRYLVNRVLSIDPLDKCPTLLMSVRIRLLWETPCRQTSLSVNGRLTVSGCAASYSWVPQMLKLNI